MENNFNTNIGTEHNSTHTIDLSDKLYKVMLAVVILAGIFMVGMLWQQFAALPQNYPQDVTVTGEGKAYGKPDVATVVLGAHTEAVSSQDAVTRNNDIMNAVIAAIKESGVEDKDIKTIMYQLAPMYDYGTGDGGGGVVPMMYPYPMPDQKRTVTGYSLDQQIEVKIRNFDKINEVLDKAAENGANNVGQLQFTIDDIEKVRAEARENAIAQAKEKAKSLFKESGLRTVKLVNIYEGYGPMPYYGYGLGGGSMDKAESIPATAPQLQPGQTEITTTVNLTYRVR